MVVIDLSTFERPKDTPEAYESRCIRNDAERAAKMVEPTERACSWERNTPQWRLWHVAYTYKKTGVIGG